MTDWTEPFHPWDGNVPTNTQLPLVGTGDNGVLSLAIIVGAIAIIVLSVFIVREYRLQHKR